MLHLSWKQIHTDVKTLATKIDVEFDVLVALQRGGSIPCTILSHILKKPMISIGVSSYNDTEKTDNIQQYQSYYTGKFLEKRVLFVDDISDTGDTFKYVLSAYKNIFSEMYTASLYAKVDTGYKPDFTVRWYEQDEWLEFPWETN